MTRTTTLLRIGTRGSPLALAQASEVVARLAAAHGMLSENFSILPIRTEGDRLQDRALAEAGGKGLFTREIDAALLNGRVDLAVHSMKDVPTILPDGLDIPAILPREDPRDVLVSALATRIADLPRGGLIGGSSLRREAQVRHLRPDLHFALLRGNVGTRLQRIAQGAFAATFLALAGLKRLDVTLDPARFAPVPLDVMLPAPAQGAIGVACRSGDRTARDLLAAINHVPSQIAVAAERALLHRLEGSCRTPVAALAEIRDDGLTLTAEVLSPDGLLKFASALTGPKDKAAEIGHDLAGLLLDQAGGRLPV